MRSVTRELPGLVLEETGANLRAAVLGPLGPEARASLREALARATATIVDLARAPDLDPDAARFLADEARRARTAGSRVSFAGASPAVYARLQDALGGALELEPRARAGEPAPAEDWGRFRVERVLSSPRGRIAFAIDPRDARRVVLKAARPAGRLAFMQAARAWSEKPSANLVRILEVDDERGFAVLEPVDGPPLDEVLARTGPLAPAQALALARGLARGLARLVEGPGAPLVHADVKPANVLVGRDGVARLSDFELARSEGDLASGEATRAYAPPERRAATPPAHRSEDAWAFGALLVELVTGSPAEEPSASSHAGPFAAIAAACLDLDPSRRPDARELVRMLDALEPASTEDALACAACGRFVYRRASAPFECVLCGGPTRPRGAAAGALPLPSSAAERLDAALRTGDARAIEAARAVALDAARTDARAALAAAAVLERLGRPRDALAMLAARPRGSSRLEGDAALAEAEARFSLGELADVRAALERERDAIAASDKRSLAAALLQARACDREGDLDGALARAARARRAAEESGLFAGALAASVVEGHALLRRGLVDGARAVLERATTRAREREPGAALPLAEARRLLALAHVRSGELRRAAELARESHDACAEAGEPLGVVRALRALAVALLEEGRPARAAEPLAVARALAARLGVAGELSRIHLLEAEVAREQGRDEAAATAARTAFALATTPRERGRALVASPACTAGEAAEAVELLARERTWDVARALVALAERLEESDRARVEAAASDAERAAREARLPVEAARAAAVLGRDALARGDREAAARHLERALDHAGWRARAALVRVRADLARAYEAAGRRVEAEEARAQARALDAFVRVT